MLKPGHFQDHNDHHDGYDEDNSTKGSSYNPNLVLEIQTECLHVKIGDIQIAGPFYKLIFYLDSVG